MVSSIYWHRNNTLIYNLLYMNYLNITWRLISLRKVCDSIANTRQSYIEVLYSNEWFTF